VFPACAASLGTHICDVVPWISLACDVEVPSKLCRQAVGRFARAQVCAIVA
jgi:hypothetical protein